MTRADMFWKSLGNQLVEYLNEQTPFHSIEAQMSGAPELDATEAELLKRIYHILNHYEIDADIRDRDKAYRERTTEQIKDLSRALTCGRLDEARKYLS